MKTFNILKLTNGETIVGEIAHADEKDTAVLEPLQLEVGESETTGNPMLIAMTWVPLMKKTNLVTIKTAHIIAVADVDEDISDYYEKSLAVLKNDMDKLQELVSREEEGEYEEVAESLQVEKTEMKLSANTVH